jgi:hypothetical protein
MPIDKLVQIVNQGKVAGEGYGYLKNPMWWAGTSTSTNI